MRGMMYLIDRPYCEWPAFVKFIHHEPTRQHAGGRTARKRSNDRRSSMDKTGQHTRARQRMDIIGRYGNLCHICLANGRTGPEALIDLALPWPDEACFTRDHLVPRSQGGLDTLDNLRPAHHQCNRDRADGPVVKGARQ